MGGFAIASTGSSLYIDGHGPLNSSFNTYTRGLVPSGDYFTEYTCGHISTTGDFSCYMRGWDTSVLDVDAYIRGDLPLNSGFDLYTVGMYGANVLIPLYIRADYPEDFDSIPCIVYNSQWLTDYNLYISGEGVNENYYPQNAQISVYIRVVERTGISNILSGMCSAPNLDSNSYYYCTVLGQVTTTGNLPLIMPYTSATLNRIMNAYTTGY